MTVDRSTDPKLKLSRTPDCNIKAYRCIGPKFEPVAVHYDSVTFHELNLLVNTNKDQDG